jgi:hypothetical protein
MPIKKLTMDRMMKSWDLGYEAGIAEGLRRAEVLHESEDRRDQARAEALESLSRSVGDDA